MNIIYVEIYSNKINILILRLWTGEKLMSKNIKKIDTINTTNIKKKINIRKKTKISFSYNFDAFTWQTVFVDCEMMVGSLGLSFGIKEGGFWILLKGTEQM